jgi:TetR/AcrR family transcriptional repressor of nem operon
VRGELEAEADPEELANFLFICYNGLQVVIQTGIERAALRESILRCLAGLPWTTV